MKKLFASSLLLLLASSLFAAPTLVQCTPAQSDVVINGIGTTASFNCPTGGTSNQIRINASVSWQENAGIAGEDYALAITTVTPFGIAPGCTAIGTANQFGQALGACTATDWTFINPAHTAVLISPFTVTVTGAPGSATLPNGGSASVSYGYEAAEVPEPGTLLMGFCGACLLALAKLKRPA